MMELRRRTLRSRKRVTRSLTSLLSKLKGKRRHGEWGGQESHSRSGHWIGTWMMTSGNGRRGLKGGEYVFSGFQLGAVEKKCDCRESSSVCRRGVIEKSHVRMGIKHSLPL